MSISILLAIYMVAVLAVSWVESKALVALHLGESLGSLLYAVVSNFVCSVVAPVAGLASAIAGFLGVFSAINNAQGITADDAFRAWAAPLALIALVIIAAVRILPLLLMNLRSPFKAFFYSVLSTVVLGVGFTLGGIALISAMSGAGNTH
jgi:hypothetical protein